MAGRDVGAKLLLGLGVVVILAGGWYSVWKLVRVEYVRERVATCTVTDKHQSDGETMSTVETAQCGVLMFRYFRNSAPVFDELEPGRTYRLRIADIEPVQYEAPVAIIGIEAPT